MRIGFLWGAAIAICLTLAVARLNTSEYSTVNDFIFNLSRFAWRFLTIPGAILGSVIGMSPEFNSAEPEIGDLALMITSNCLVFGFIGAFVGWRVERARIEDESPQLSRGERMLKEGIPEWTIYWKTILRRGLWGGFLGAIVNLLLLGLAFATAGGHSLSGLFIWWFGQPTFILLDAIGIPKGPMSELTMGFFLLLCFVNTVLIGLVCVVTTAITETWLFFRKH